MRVNKKKKAKLKVKNIIFLIIVIVTLSSLSFGGFFVYDRYFKANIKENEIVLPPEPVPEVYEASLIAVGDNLIHETVAYDAKKHANYNGYNFKPMITLIKDIVSEHDIGYYNQETVLAGGVAGYPRFNSPYEVGDAMIDAGFNLVSLATNHTVDRGKSGVINSCNYWKKQEGVMTAGSYCSMEERNEIKIAEVNNITYTMLNYTYGTNGMPVSDSYLVNVWPTNEGIEPSKNTSYQKYKEQVKTDILAVRDKVDVLIVAMHWGREYTHTPTKYEVDMANYLASLDVDIIIGTHPHVIQPVAWIDDTLVIYSLGNFLSAQYQNADSCTNYKCMVGLMTSLRIEKTVFKGETSIKVDNIENELIYNYYNQSTWRGYKMIPFSNPEIKKYLKNYKSVYETYRKVVVKMDDTMTVNPVYTEIVE